MKKEWSSLNEDEVYEVKLDGDNSFQVIHNVDLRQVDPFVYKFIRVVNERNFTLGYDTYENVFKNGCKVNLHLLVPKVAILTTNEDSAEEGTFLKDKCSKVYSCGVFFDELPKEWNFDGFLFAVEQRIGWIVNGMLRYPFEDITEPPYDVVSVLWCSVIPMMMRRLNPPSRGITEGKEQLAYLREVDQLVIAFERTRLQFEKDIFTNLMEPFTLKGNERELIDLLLLHGIPNVVLKNEILVKGTISDNRVAFVRNLYNPVFYLRVKLQDVPHDVGVALPMYPGGYVHLHPVDVIEWLWQRSLAVWKNISNNLWAAPPKMLDERLLNLARDTFNRLKYYKECNLLKISQRREPGACISGVDESVLPPCLRFNRWVKDRERTQVLFSLQKANVDIEDCGNILLGFHQKEFPGTTLEDTKRKWDWTQYGGNKKAYAPQGCETFIANAKSGTSDNVIKCPYASKEGSIEGCKKACVTQFRSRFKSPPTYATPENLFAPYQYITWSHKAINYERKHF